ncbi:MAG: M43 family zinc metalloprotease [Cryomorphaceae bacterium]
MRNFLLFALLVCIPFFADAQDECGTAIHANHMRSIHPEIGAPDELDPSLLQAQLEEVRSGRAETIIIPVVFTILHDNGPEHIVDDQIRDALRVLNEGFNAENAELDDVVSAFQGIIGDAELEFRLAAKDPNGNFTTGIQRIESMETYVGDNGSKISGWPRSMYLNFWVSDVITVVGASASAFSTMPVYDPQAGTDGIISNHRYLGTIGTAISDGHTLTHESGHFFNLHHTWGTGNFPGCDGTATNSNDPCFGLDNCSDDDGVSDTPNCLGVDNSSCNTAQTTCGSLDNVQNHMDYASCEAMFTEGQVARMRAALNSSSNAAFAARKSLHTEANYAATGMTELTSAAYRVARHTACRGEAVQFFDDSRYDAETWDWNITGPQNFTSSEKNPTFTFDVPGMYSVELTVTQGSITMTVSDDDAFFVTDVYGAPMPFREDFSSPADQWITVNTGIDDDKYKWQYKTDVGYDDDESYMVYNIGNDDKNHDELILAGVDFRSMTQVDIDFKVAYGKTNNDDNDKLFVLISNDCGDTWKTIWSATSGQLNGGKPLTTSVFKPSSQSDWESFSISNVPLTWLGPNAMIKFDFEPGGGNQLYIDNINIDGEYSIVPFLVYPDNNASQMNSDVVLDWRAVPGADAYEFQLSKNASFTANVASGTQEAIDDEDSGKEDTRFKTSDLEFGQTYFWRVRTVSGGTNSEWSDAWSFTVADDGVGLSELSAQELIVYPNPSKGQINLRLPTSVQDLQVSIYSMNGQLMDRRNVASMQSDQDLSIPVNGLPNGIYFIQAKSADNHWNQRFTISR